MSLRTISDRLARLESNSGDRRRSYFVWCNADFDTRKAAILAINPNADIFAVSWEGAGK